MMVKFWGVRGSIPVCGRQFLKYGGSTSCVEIIDSSGNNIIVDSGTGIKNLGKKMIKEKVKRINMLFTHQHWDHVLGFPFFAPIYQNVEIKVMGGSYSTDEAREIIAKTMQPPGFPVKFEEIEAKFSFAPVCKEGCKIGEIKIFPIEISHPNGGLGYRFEKKGVKFVFLTDNELGYFHQGAASYEEYVSFCQGADLLVHDADYTPDEYEKRKTWGHSTWEMALKLAEDSQVKSLGLFHHNQERSDEQVDKIVSLCNKKKRKKSLNIFACAEGMSHKLNV
ncbi:MAG: MBL fold metallo-hydrolase [Elusimicrobia bacterium]|nr:MBL fold metallo-hydrolase [Elusimicrobiota bacterium]